MSSYTLGAFRVSSEISESVKSGMHEPSHSGVVSSAALNEIAQIWAEGRRRPISEFLFVLIQTLRESSTEIPEAFEAGDEERVFRSTHKLRSVAANLGAAEFLSVLEKFDQSIRSGSAVVIGRDLDELQKIIRFMILELSMIGDSLIENASGDVFYESEENSESTETVRLLVVEDSLVDQQLFRASLEREFHLVIVPTAEEALEVLKNETFDAVIIDLLLPGQDGLKLCEAIRTGESDLPILMVSIRNAVEDRIRAFALGADDYVSKPFDPRELRLRVAARLKKQPKSSLDWIRAGQLQLDGSAQRAFLESRSGKLEDLELTPSEYRMLVLFVRNPGKPLSRKDLVSMVSGSEIHVLERTVDKHICSLRRKLSHCRHYIETVPKRGYRFKF